jgi:hypothetical protein
VAAARAGREPLAGVVRHERRALLAELHALRALAVAGDDLAALLTEGAALQVEARLRLLDLAEEDATALVAAAAAPAAAPARSSAERRAS